MSIDLSTKRIIMIHGLASKPSEKDLHSLWKKCIIENIRVDDKTLAKDLDSNNQVFKSAYWANATPHHIEDDANYVKKLSIQVDKVISERQNIKDNFHVGTKEEVGAFFKDKGIKLISLVAGALTVKDDIVKTFLRETELYNEDQYIADRMREPLESQLRSAWDSGCDVALLSHSMGTFIAYDVLWRFSHRNTPEFKKYKNKRVQMFVTMGSPLGDSLIREMLFAKHHKKNGIRQYPNNIDFWHNYACLGDAVSYQKNFDEIFFTPMRDLNIIPKNRPKYRAIDYLNLHNPFEVVSYAGNKGKEKSNPHKSFGYLVQPRLGTWLTDFLKGDLKY